MIRLRLAEGRWMADRKTGGDVSSPGSFASDFNATTIEHCTGVCDDAHPPLPSVVELAELLRVGDGASAHDSCPQVPNDESSSVVGATR